MESSLVVCAVVVSCGGHNCVVASFWMSFWSQLKSHSIGQRANICSTEHLHREFFFHFDFLRVRNLLFTSKFKSAWCWWTSLKAFFKIFSRRDLKNCLLSKWLDAKSQKVGFVIKKAAIKRVNHHESKHNWTSAEEAYLDMKSDCEIEFECSWWSQPTTWSWSAHSTTPQLVRKHFALITIYSLHNRRWPSTWKIQIKIEKISHTKLLSTFTFFLSSRFLIF